MTAMTSWQNRKNNGTCKKSACQVFCDGERFAAKPAHLDRVEDPLNEGFAACQRTLGHSGYLGVRTLFTMTICMEVPRSVCVYGRSGLEHAQGRTLEEEATHDDRRHEVERDGKDDHSLARWRFLSLWPRCVCRRLSRLALLQLDVLGDRYALVVIAAGHRVLFVVLLLGRSRLGGCSVLAVSKVVR